MTKLLLNKLRREEDGAVAVMVALLLVVFMAMLAFAVDVGAMHLRRREMVNGADAAALAAATRYTVTGSKTGVDQTALTQFKYNLDDNAVANGNIVADALVWGDLDNQGQPHSVTVTYHTDQEMYFSPVFGFADSHEVSSTATAYWKNGKIGPGTVTWTCGNPDDALSLPCHPRNGPLNAGKVPICHTSSTYQGLLPDVSSTGDVQGHEGDTLDIIPIFKFQDNPTKKVPNPPVVITAGRNWPTITKVIPGYEYLLGTSAADFLGNGCGAPGLHVWLGK